MLRWLMLGVFLLASSPVASFAEEVKLGYVDLQRALLALSPKQREVVVLRYLVDLPEAEVAKAMRCSVGTVKTHASRGLASLRRSLEVAS